MPPDDNPVDTGTGEGTPVTLDQAAAHMVEVNRDREDKSDNADAPPDDSDAAKEVKEARKGVDDEDWLADEADPEQKPDGEAAETPETGQFVGISAKVRMPDGSTLSVADLVKGNMFQSDYSRKTEAASQQAKAAETRLKAASDLEQSLTEQREMVIHFLASVQPQPPDPALAQSDPLKWIEANAQYQQQQQNWQQWVSGFKTTSEKQRAAANAETETRMAELERSELAKLQDKLPHFKDAAKATKASETIKKYLVNDYGYKPDEVTRIIDHRFAHIAHDAVRYRLGLSKSKAAIENGNRQPAVQRPGQRIAQANANSARISQLQKRFDQSGSLEDATALRVAQNQKA